MRLGKGAAEPLLTYVIEQPRRRGDRACQAAAHLALAALARESGDISTGLAYAQSSAGLLHHSRPRNLADQLAFEKGRLLHDGARHTEAVDLLEPVAERLGRRGDRNGAVLALSIAAASATVQDSGKGMRLVVAAREMARRALDLQGLIRTELLLAQIAAVDGDEELARSAANSTLELAQGNAEWYWDVARNENLGMAVEDQAVAQGGAHLVLARIAADSGQAEEALEHTVEAIRLSEGANRSHDVATAELMAAEICESQERSSAALGHALTAVANIDRARYMLPTPRWRADWVSGNEAAYGMALRLAAAKGNGRLVAELVESARLQAVPRTNQGIPSGRRSFSAPAVLLDSPRQRPQGLSIASRNVTALRAAAAQAALGADPLQPVPVLMSDGRRLLPRAEATAGRLVVDIGDGVTRLAGKGAWWWGGAFAGDTYYWAVWDGTDFLCGSVPAGPDSAAAKALHELTEATPGPGLREQQKVLAGPFAGRKVGEDDPRTREAALSWCLAEAFVPQPIREFALRWFEDAQSNVRPPRIVVSLPAALSRLPVAMLAIRKPLTGSGGFSDAPRLLEACVIHHAPSMALIASIAPRAPVGRPGPERPWPL